MSRATSGDTMTYKLFLDDLRAPPNETWVVARTVQSAYEYINTYGLPREMSLDHDLGGAEDAPALLRRLISDYLDGRFLNLKKVSVSVHSANPVGRQNLEGIWKSFIEFDC